MRSYNITIIKIDQERASINYLNQRKGICHMTIITPTNKAVETLTGLHLYHGAISNCSMRVRMTLIEKGLAWESHHLDLKKKENISDEYFGIKPEWPGANFN